MDLKRLKVAYLSKMAVKIKNEIIVYLNWMMNKKRDWPKEEILCYCVACLQIISNFLGVKYALITALHLSGVHFISFCNMFTPKFMFTHELLFPEVFCCL